MKYIYLFIGMMSLALGCIGIVLPILPTTPFLLLAGFCFARSSKRVHQWFVSSKIYQKHLDSFVKRRAMTLKTKVCILSFASIMLAFPLILTDLLLLRLLIIGLYCFKYYYFLVKIETIKAPQESI
ncbi:YbaN family protein [Allocoprobacillus halotolerans]|uniref:YbaN family protein n=1 Tax=Allocoprobacillus halotolerans TaxID=2944914 RepID=A0ABY5I5B1_9FIRM|nr:YbaN family protein [Allocoprobacillus halotolerans]UTY39150.1 YbaN family protein [Allocoprobacillus halotolerans]